MSNEIKFRLTCFFQAEETKERAEKAFDATSELARKEVRVKTPNGESVGHQVAVPAAITAAPSVSMPKCTICRFDHKAQVLNNSCGEGAGQGLKRSSLTSLDPQMLDFKCSQGDQRASH